MTGVKLLRRVLGGPQDMALTDEANDATIKLWKFAGGDPGRRSGTPPTGRT